MSKCVNPITAIIDSGIGGVSVLKQIIEKYQAGNFIYFADNNNMPYGNKTKDWLINHLNKIITFLKENYDVDFIVIACNTASSAIRENQLENVILMEFDNTLQYYATRTTKQNMKHINVIADKTLAKQIEKHIFNNTQLNKIVKNHIKKHKLDKLKEIVLGCTHYELVKEIFKKYCPNTHILANSQFMLNKINISIKSNELNLVVLTSKEDNSLKNKIHKLIRS